MFYLTKIDLNDSFKVTDRVECYGKFDNQIYCTIHSPLDDSVVDFVEPSVRNLNHIKGLPWTSIRFGLWISTKTFLRNPNWNT